MKLLRVGNSECTKEFHFLVSSGTLAVMRRGGWDTKTVKLFGGGAYSFVGCRSRLTIDHASLSRRSTVES